MMRLCSRRSDRAPVFSRADAKSNDAPGEYRPTLGKPSELSPRTGESLEPMRMAAPCLLVAGGLEL